ncbi:MAG TPA: hypothetical protein VE972_02300 [Conexibacter sp.]|nr:hypothetical protein [Conexibacter sp.]
MDRAAILNALGLAGDLSDAQVAEGLRSLGGMPPQGTTDASLWGRFLEGIVLARHGAGGARGDLAILADRVVSWAIVPPGLPGEQRWGAAAWDRELGLARAQSDDRLRMFVIDEIAPRLWDAGLFYVIDYV